MSWCSENLRDCQAWVDEGLPLSTTSNEAAKYLDAVIRQYVSWIDADELGGIEESLNRLMKADPDFVMGDVLEVGLELIGTGRTTRLDPEFAKQVEALRGRVAESGITKREQLHAKAICQFADGHYNEACTTWEAILSTHPLDMLALKFSHDGYFYLGNLAEIRDSVNRVLPVWKPSMLLYGHLKGMLSFGLEENNQFDDALKTGMEALEMNRQDAWATHAVAHCYEMTGRFDDGIRFMSTTLKDWNPCGMLASHNHWHWALYHIERGETETALGIFDREIGKRVESGALLDIVDASSLLLRLKMEDVTLSRDQWETVATIVEPHAHDHILVFNDAHIAAALLGANSEDSELFPEAPELQHQSLVDFVRDGVGTNAGLSRDYGLPLLQGLGAYFRGEFDEAALLLQDFDGMALRPIGGSNAQRDIFDLLRINAHLRSSDIQLQKAAHPMICARLARKANSPLNQRLQARFDALHLNA